MAMGNCGQGPEEFLPGKEKSPLFEEEGAERANVESSSEAETGIGVSGRCGERAEIAAAEANGKANGGVDCCPTGERTEERPREGATVKADERADKSAAVGPNKEETPRG